MSSPPDQPHLVSLALQSKKALQHGEQLCSRAHAVSNASAHSIVDVVALDAKVRWFTGAVIDQLKFVAGVAKSVKEKRAHLVKQVQAWDVLRTKHSTSLDNVLESLGSILVPPDFHQSASPDSSLFGSQLSDGKPETKDNHKPYEDKQKDKQSQLEARKWWKTLRDFIDEQAIEDVLDTIENDRLGLDDIMSKTDQYPETLNIAMNSIRDSLPEHSEPPAVFVENILAMQDTISTSMAVNLESLASHYHQMASAVKESETGEAYDDEDLHDMNRDTRELPLIMGELEEGADAIGVQHDKLRAAQELSEGRLSILSHTLDDLDQLGEVMTEILQTQEDVEGKCEEELNGLHNHLLTLEHLHDRFVAYQTAFSKLVLELDRRRQYRTSVENIVRGMINQLEVMTQEESQVRSHFNSEYGAHLPEDVCLCVGNTPTKWEIVPWSGDALEFLPALEDDIIAQAKDRIRVISDVGQTGPGTEMA